MYRSPIWLPVADEGMKGKAMRVDKGPEEGRQTLREKIYRFVFTRRLTTYQSFCLRVAEKALDLPDRMFRRGREGEHGVIGDQNTLDSFTVEKWLLEAAQVDALSSMVLLDAVEFLLDMFRVLDEDHRREPLESRFKREFTQVIRGTIIEFCVPEGWGFQFLNDDYFAGSCGVAIVSRCHLSQVPHDAWGLGTLLGAGKADSMDIGYFNIPCEIAPRIWNEPVRDEKEWVANKWFTGFIPYQWITGSATSRSTDGTLDWQPPPSDERILEVADEARKRVEEFYRKIESKP